MQKPTSNTLAAPLHDSTAAPIVSNQPDCDSPSRRINPWRLFIGAMVPNWLLMRREVSQGAKLCYARLAQYAGQNNDCRPRQETLAVELGVGERMVNEYLRELRQFKLVECERRGLGMANRIHFLDHRWMHEGPALRATSSSEPKGTAIPDPQSSSAPVNKENQVKENQEGEYIHAGSSGSRSLPSTEEEAAEWAAVCGVPPAFATAEFNRMVAVNWLDGCSRPVGRWREYIKSRWSREQSDRAERAIRSSSRPAHTSLAKRPIASTNFNQTKF